MKMTYMLSFFPMTSKIEMQSQEKGFDLILTSFFFFFFDPHLLVALGSVGNPHIQEESVFWIPGPPFWIGQQWGSCPDHKA